MSGSLHPHKTISQHITPDLHYDSSNTASSFTLYHMLYSKKSKKETLHPLHFLISSSLSWLTYYTNVSSFQDIIVHEWLSADFNKYALVMHIRELGLCGKYFCSEMNPWVLKSDMKLRVHWGKKSEFFHFSKWKFSELTFDCVYNFWYNSYFWHLILYIVFIQNSHKGFNPWSKPLQRWWDICKHS